VRRFAPIAAIAVGSLLLAGCQSKRDICAQYEAQSTTSGLNPPEMNFMFWQHLGIKGPRPSSNREVEVANNRFCRFYKS
tara:strand:+ start:4129 stop:4365 length:237 start_codon:yes stop_codon:yes gene_type:complete